MWVYELKSVLTNFQEKIAAIDPIYCIQYAQYKSTKQTKKMYVV